METQTDIQTVPCQRCSGYGWIEYEVDYFGRKTEWGRCGECGGTGEIEIEQEAAA